jgi:xylan 1,4-beta-xylosidase
MKPTTSSAQLGLSKHFLVLAIASSVTAAAQVPTPVSINVNAGNATGPFTHVARFFGADEPNLVYYPQGKELLTEMGHVGTAQTYFRTHNLLTTGDGIPALKWGSTNAYTQDAQGNPIYNWTLVDRIFDTYLQANVKPYAQVGFMPEALSTHPEPYKFVYTPYSNSNVIYTGWSNPPTSYEKWAELVYQWVKHCVERYGDKEVETWIWEVWNEPNIAYWNGTVDEFYKLHDYSVDSVLRALPTAQIAGPETAGGPGGDYLKTFLEHVLHETNYATGRIGSKLDYLSFHAKGSPTWVNSTTNPNGGFVRMGLSTQLKNMVDAYTVIASYPELREKPILISECDPDGCGDCYAPQYGYRNGLLYPSFTAASFVRALDLSVEYGVNLQGALTWAFQYNNYAYFENFRVSATNGIDKPLINFHRMMGKMSGQRLDASSSAQVPLDTAVTSGIRGDPDVGVLSSLEDKRRLSVLVWHYHDDDLPKPDANVTISIENLPWSGNARLTHYRVDNGHSNSYTLWLKQGSPQHPTPEQYTALKAAGQLATLGKPQRVKIAKGGQAKLSFALPIHAVSLLVLEPEAGHGW